MTGPIVQGKDFNYFRRLTISSTTFLESSDVEFSFRGNPSFTLINESTDTIEYSFNGNTLHGDLVGGTPSATLVSNNRGVSKIWFRVPNGDPVDIRVEATAPGTFAGGGSSSSSGGGGGGVADSVAITGPLGNKTKSQSVAVTLSTNEPTITIDGAVTANIGTTNGLALDSTLTSLNGKFNSLGQKAMAASAPVVIASDQSAVPISGTITANIGTSGSLALDASITSLSAKFSSLGQNTMTASTPVVIASDQAAIPVTGTFSSASTGVNNSAIPTSSTQLGISDGTNLQAARAFDLDTGAGTEYDLGISFRLPGSGGSVAGGTSTNPIRIDPTGTTTQPVSGTVTSNIGTTNGLALDSNITSLSGKFGSLGQKAMTGSSPVVIASDQSAIPVSGTITSNIGTTNGLALDTTLAKLTITQSTALGSNTQTMVGGSVTTAAPTYTTGNINPLSLTTAGALRVDNSAITQPVSGTITANIGTSGSLALDASITSLSAKFGSLGQKTMAGSAPVVIASDQAAIPVTGTFSSASTGTNNSSIPTSSTQLGGSDGTNLQAARIFDLDTGGGTEYDLGISLRLPSSGGSVAGGTSTNPIRTDPTGTTTQPVSGTITANIGTSGSLALDASITSLSAKFGSLGQKTMAGSTPVVIASDQAAIPVTGTFSSASTGVNNNAIPTSSTQLGISDGTNLQAARGFDLDSGAGTEYDLGISIRLPSSGGSVAGGTVTDPLRTDPTGTTIQPVSGTITANIGTSGSLALDANITSLSAKFGSLGQKTMAGSAPVVLASDQAAIPVTGTFSSASTGVNNSAIPTSSTQIGGSDGTNLQAATVFDLDTAGGTEYDLGISLRLPGSGGSVAGGTATNPLRTDPTGTTTQPVSGTVTSNIGTTNGLTLDTTLAKLTIAQSTALGSNTQTMVGGSVTTAAPTYTTGNINPLSLTTTGALRVDNSASTQPISGTITANIGTSGSLALDATLTGGTQTTGITDGTNTATVTAASTAAVATDKAVVVAISPNNSVVVVPTTAATSTLTAVGSSTSSVTLLSSNTSRKGAAIYNDSTSIVYVKFGTTASSTSFTVILTSNSYYEVPFNYTGRIDGIWVSVNGNARMTELT